MGPVHMVQDEHSGHISKSHYSAHEYNPFVLMSNSFLHPLHMSRLLDEIYVTPRANLYLFSPTGKCFILCPNRQVIDLFCKFYAGIDPSGLKLAMQCLHTV